MIDLALVGGTLVSPSGRRAATIGVDQGVITFIGDAVPSARRTIDASNQYVLPGTIEPHCHFRDPAYPEHEDIRSATTAAAASGVTTVLEMPVSIPPVTSAARLRARREHLEHQAIVDFGLYAGAGWTNLDEIADLAREGAVAFKSYLTRPPPERAAEWDGVWVRDREDLKAVMRAVASSGSLLALHAEDPTIIASATAAVKRAGRRDAAAYMDSRPPSSEVEAVRRAVGLALETGVRLHFVHLTTAGAAEVVKDAKSRGLPVTMEVCFAHLWLNADDMLRFGPYAKLVPPLRGPDDQQGLWDRVLDGTVDVVGTDHCPFADPTVYESASEDIWLGPGGLPLLELRLPFLLDQASRGRLSLETVVRVLSDGPAKLFGLYPRKGSLTVGADADLAVVDLGQPWTVRIDELHTRARGALRAFAGRSGTGQVTSTVVRGRVVMRDGKVTGMPGYGRWVEANT